MKDQNSLCRRSTRIVDVYGEGLLNDHGVDQKVARRIAAEILLEAQRDQIVELLASRLWNLNKGPALEAWDWEDLAEAGRKAWRVRAAQCLRNIESKGAF